MQMSKQHYLTAVFDVLLFYSPICQRNEAKLFIQTVRKKRYAVIRVRDNMCFMHNLQQFLFILE